MILAIRVLAANRQSGRLPGKPPVSLHELTLLSHPAAPGRPKSTTRRHADAPYPTAFVCLLLFAAAPPHIIMIIIGRIIIHERRFIAAGAGRHAWLRPALRVHFRKGDSLL